MLLRLVCGIAIAFSLAANQAWAEDDDLVGRARSILERVPLVDGHNDLAWETRERFGGVTADVELGNDLSALDPPLHTDLPRLRRGGVGAQFWSVYVPAEYEPADAVVATLEQIDVVKRYVERYPDALALALSAADIRRIHGSRRIASLIGMEGGHSIAGSLAVLRQMYEAGARYMTLTHSATLPWADSSTDAPEHDGLTTFGMEVVREMNRLGMLVDLSHVSIASMHDALDATVAPVIFSHSSARALTNHPRNVPDEVLRRLPENGGVVMITFVPPFISEEVRLWTAERDAAEARFETLHEGAPGSAAAAFEQWKLDNPAPRSTLAQVADHIDHVRSIAGIDHIGIGSDFDGISSTPAGLEDVSTFPALLAELLRRGYSEEEVAKIAGLNLLRVFERAESVARKLRATRGPSEMKSSP